MSAPWWVPEAELDARPVMVAGDGPAGQQPQVHGDVDTLMRTLLARALAYTPEWTNLHEGDAGHALLRLFGEMAEPVLYRLNRLPEKIFIEFLRTAGVTPLPAQAARATLVFTAADGAPDSVFLPRGFQVSAQAAEEPPGQDTTSTGADTDNAEDTDAPAADRNGAVIFETLRNLRVAPMTIAALLRRQGGTALLEEIDISMADAGPEASPWPLFGHQPRVGASLLIGLSAAAAASGSLNLGLELADGDGVPAPVIQGGVAAQSGPGDTALVRWEILDGGQFRSLAVIRDDSRGMRQSGIVELDLPDRWRQGLPEGVERDDLLYWLRLRLVHGEFARPPLLRRLLLNAVEAEALRTIRDEVLDYVPGSERRRMRLSQTPVVPGSLQLVVDEGGLDGSGEVLWQPTGNLALHGPDDRVYVLSAEAGELEFGDGIHGKRLPRGFRHVQARQYKVGGGRHGRVAAGAIDTLVQSVPFLTAVDNPAPASGGRSEEPLRATLRRGPEQLRARNRAVTLADYALLARQAEGADVQRAHAIANRDPRFGRTVIPGAVAVLLVSSDRGEEMPLPEAGSLKAVSAYLSEQVAPAGVQVAAAIPHFHQVSVRVGVVLRDGADTGAVVRQALQALQYYLHPLTGGVDGNGWPFGGIIRHQAVVRMLLDRVPGLRAVAFLNLLVDGVLRERCEDFTPEPDALIWPVDHDVMPLDGGSSS